MTTTTGNTGIPTRSPVPAPVRAADPDEDPTVPTPVPPADPDPVADTPAEGTPAPTEEPAEAPAEPEPAPAPEVSTAAAEMTKYAGDVEASVLGDATGWWIVTESPRGKKRLGPYGMMESFTKCNQLRGLLMIKGKLKA